MMFRALNRRRLVALGLGLLATSFPMRLLTSRKSDGAVVDMTIRFPEGYTMDQYEYDVPIWAKNEELRSFIGSFMRDGKLIDYQKNGHVAGVDYRFTFSSVDDLKAFIRGVRNRDLVNFESRSSRGLIAVMRVNGVEFEC